jgi:hypothetical protein
MGLEPNNADAKKEVQRGLPFSFYPLVLSLSGHLCLPTHAGVCLSVVASPSIIPPPQLHLVTKVQGEIDQGKRLLDQGKYMEAVRAFAQVLAEVSPPSFR